MENVTISYFIKVLVIAMAWLIVSNILKKLLHNFFDKAEFVDIKRAKTIENILKSIINAAGIIIIVIVALQEFVPVTKLLAGAGVLGVIIGISAQSIIKDFLTGMFRVSTRQIHKGDYVKINGKHTGTIEDVGLLFLQIRDWSGRLLTLNNGEIKEIQNYNMGKMRVIEQITTSFREDPEKVHKVLEEACEYLNKNHGEYLKKDEKGNIIEPFQVYGLTNLNNQFKGYEFTLTGLVEEEVYFTASKIVRMQIAKTCHKHSIKMAEENKFYQTRATINKG